MMTRRSRRSRLAEVAPLVVLSVSLLGAGTGCASGLSQPFSAMNAMKGQQMTVYWLQSYEAPPAAQAQNTVPNSIGGLVLPPQIQQLGQQLLSAGMTMFPGFLQGLVPPQAPTQAADVPRFHGFAIRKYQPVADSGLKGSILDLFGHSSNFKSPGETCMYADFGFALAQPNAPPADILVSLSCQQVQSYNFQWPYAQTGLTQDALGKIGAVVNKVFQGT
jgi:hypothetical protein